MVADRKVKFKAAEKELKNLKSEIKRHQDALSQGRANADTTDIIRGLENKIKQQKSLLKSGIREFSKHGIKGTSREL